jgi:hypothetical protein
MCNVVLVVSGFINSKASTVPILRAFAHHSKLAQAGVEVFDGFYLQQAQVSCGMSCMLK